MKGFLITAELEGDIVLEQVVAYHKLDIYKAKQHIIGALIPVRALLAHVSSYDGACSTNEEEIEYHNTVESRRRNFDKMINRLTEMEACAELLTDTWEIGEENPGGPCCLKSQVKIKEIDIDYI